VGGVGDSRYEFRGGSGGEIRGDRARGGHDGEVGASVVDCAGGAGDCNGPSCESAHTMAVVYRTLCAGGGVQHVSSRRRTCLWSVIENGAHRADGDAVLDRNWYFASNTKTGGTSSANARRPIVAGCFGYIAVVDSARMDPALGDRVLIFFGIVLKQDGEKPEGSDRDHDEAAEHANQKHCAKSVDEPVGHCRHLPKPSYSIAVSHHRSFWVSEMPETETQGPVLWVVSGQ